MNIKKELGEKIKRLRKSKGFTQEYLAEKIEISSRNLSNIELGINFPKAETLERIIETLDVSTEELFANDHIKTKAELIDDINFYIGLAKEDYKSLELIYKILRDIFSKI